MSELRINDCVAYERELGQNWAAAYAKRLYEQETDERDRAIAAAVGEEAAARVEAVAGEEAARAAKDNALADGTALENNCIYSRHIREGNVTTGKIHDLNVTEQKLANGAVTNSKLASDVFATVQETRWGQDTHKAVTPDGLKQGIGHIIPATVIHGEFMMDNIICDSIDADVTSIFGNPVRDAGLRDYSETPQMVGTWIDGTPVWRAVIDRALTSVDLEDAYHNALDDITNVRADVKLVLEGRAILTGESPSCIDYVDCVLEPDGTFSWDASQQSGSGFTHLVGCIVFVTEASNIRA